MVATMAFAESGNLAASFSAGFAAAQPARLRRYGELLRAI